jgi:hypothetical protein
VALYTPALKRRAAWATALLGVLWFAKTIVPDQPWSLKWTVSEELPAVRDLNEYASMKRPNELILIDTDDEFYSFILPLPRVRYCFIDPDHAVASFAPHLAFLGITVTRDQFRALPSLQPEFTARLQQWGLTSTEPIATSILLDNVAQVEELVNDLPTSDFYVPSKYLTAEKRSSKHARLPFSNGYTILLSPNYVKQCLQAPPASSARSRR